MSWHESTGRRAPIGFRCVVVAVGLMSSHTGAARGQEVTTVDVDLEPTVQQLAELRGATMSMKLERTFLKVDVLRLTVRVDSATADRLSTVLTDQPRYERDVEDSVANAVRDAGETIAVLEFLRNIRLDQFLDGIDEDMGHARDGGWIRHDTYGLITTGVRTWFGFLEERGIRKGDRITYHALGDTLRTTYRGVDGTELLLDQTDVGRENVQAFYGGYFSPGSSFRRKLIRSLWGR